MFMAFELNQLEISLLKDIDAEAERLRIEFDSLYPKHEDNEARSKAEHEALNALWDKGKAIRRQARIRSIKYYSSHIDELITALHEEIRNRMILMASLEESDKRPRPVDMWKANIEDSLSQYTALLNEAERKNINNFIEEAIKHRKKLWKNAQAKRRTAIQATTAKKAQEIIYPLDKLSQVLFDNRKNGAFYNNTAENIPVWVGDRSKKHANIIVSVNIDELRKYITLGRNTILDPYNRAIHDAVISLYNAGNTHFTPDMLYHFMTGYRRIDKAPEGFRKALDEALTKLMYTSITIDTKNEAELFGLENFQYKGYLLPLTYTRAKINGQDCECWKILERPPLLALAERKNQIGRSTANLLDTGLNTTPDNVVLTHYLLDQILIMQNPKSNRNTTILYDSVYEYLGIDAPNANALKKRKLDIREKIKAILDAWTKSGFISGYGELLEGRKIKGVNITLVKRRK